MDSKAVSGLIEQDLKNILAELKKIKSSESRDLAAAVEQAIKLTLERSVASFTSEPLFQSVLIRSVALGQRKLLNLIFPLIQRLFFSPPIHPSFTSTVLNILRAQAEINDEAIRLKIIQTVMLLISSASQGDANDLLGASFLNALIVCLRLCSCKEKSVANTATAALRQLVELLMERVGVCVSKPIQAEVAASSNHDGYALPTTTLIIVKNLITEITLISP
jgi:hypothetical protein